MLRRGRNIFDNFSRSLLTNAGPYANRSALLLNGRFNKLVYGSYAPGAPNVFIDDAQWKTMWLGPERCYLVASDFALPRLEKLVDKARLM